MDPDPLFGEVGGLDGLADCGGGAEIVIGSEDQLRAARAGGDADAIEEDGGFVDEDGVGLLCAEDGDAAADVAGERLHVFEGSHFCFAPTGEARQLFEVECGVAGDDGENVVMCAVGGQQSFEDLLGGHTDLFCDGDCGQVFGIDFVLAKLEGNVERFKEARAVGLHWVGLPGSSDATRPAWRVMTKSAMGAACSR